MGLRSVGNVKVAGGLDGLADLPGEHEVAHLGVRGLALRGEREGRGVLLDRVDTLDEHAAVDGAHLELGVARGTAGGQNAQGGALGEALEGLGREARGDENLDEELVTVGEVLDERQRDLTIYGDDAAGPRA